MDMRNEEINRLSEGSPNLRMPEEWERLLNPEWLELSAGDVRGSSSGSPRKESGIAETAFQVIVRMRWEYGVEEKRTVWEA